MAGGWLGTTKKPRLTLVVGDRAMAINWARQQGVDEKYVVATTEGDRRLQGLAYAPVLVENGRIPKHVTSSPQHEQAMIAWQVLNSMFGSGAKR